jgi:hypothetical protein
MRTAATEIVTGRVAGSGLVYEGPCSVQRVSAGKYNIYAPPGRKFVSISATPYTPSAWLMDKSDGSYGSTAQVTFATTASAETDTQFIYTAVLAA